MAGPATLGSTLAGLRVLDLSSNLAGPLTGMVLADLGADVVKVERPLRGDDTRSLPPDWDGEGTVFMSVNRNKRSVALDLRSADARATVLRLAANADVFIESFGPGVAARLGLGFEDVSRRSPSVIYCTISAFGSGEVGRSLPGYDSLIQGFSGMMSITGHPDGPPARVAPSAVDLSTGLWSVIAVLAALQRRKDGHQEPQHIETALLDSAINLMGHQVLGHLASGAEPSRLGTASPSTAPNEAFAAADDWVIVATANDAQFRKLCTALGLDSVAEDPRFASVRDRVRNRSALRASLEERFRERPAEAWIERLREAGVAAGRLNTLPEALAHPLIEERVLLVAPGTTARLRELPQIRTPIDPEGACIRSAPPLVGQHSEEVMTDSRWVGVEESGIDGREPQRRAARGQESHGRESTGTVDPLD